MSITNTAACNRGCAMKNKHLTDCDDDECRGCLPRRAEYGLLCWPCHRRLELMFHDADTVDRWLTGNMTAGSGAAPTGDQLAHTKAASAPLPIKVQIYDQRQVLRDFYAGMVDELCEKDGLHGPDHHSARDDSRYLLSFISHLEKWDTIGDYWEYLAENVSLAHALAPWRPEMRRLRGVPCPECGETNLGIFGGESDVTCLSCRTMIREEHYGLWEKIVKEAS